MKVVFAALVLCACGSDENPGADAASDVTTKDVAETGVADAADAGTEAGCAKQACLDTASDCANGCDDQFNTCEGNCVTQKCMQGCGDAEATCLSGCLSACKTCAADAACALGSCPDAATP